jgi:hypothetical protein
LLLASHLFARFLSGRLVDYLHHVLLELLFLQEQPIFAPYEVMNFRVETIISHASLKQANHVLVVRFFNEFQFPAIIHELLKLFWVSFAELINSDINLLFLDIAVLLILASAGKSLPWQAASEEV